MREWALLGILTLTACADVDRGTSLGQRQEECRNVASQTALEPEAPDGREAVLVHYRSQMVGAAAVRDLEQVTARLRSRPVVAARVTPRELARLSEDPNVERIEPDVTVRAFGTPMTAGSVDEYTPALRLVQASRVWDANDDGVLDTGALTGAGIRVCIIDSGIDRQHPELRVPYTTGWDFVDGDADPSDESNGVRGLGHGTHVAGVIAAQLASAGATGPGMSRGGIMGVAPGVELLIARVLDVNESASVGRVLEALEWCQAQKAHLVSLSLGSPMDMGRTARDAFQAAREAGMLIIAASGNDSTLQREAPLSYPSAFPSVLSVGAVDSDGRVATFSNRGDGLSLVAPGVDVLSSISTQGTTVSELESLSERYPSRSLLYAPAGEYTGTLVDCGQGEVGGCRGGTCEGFVAYVRVEGNFGAMSRLARNVMQQGARAIVFGVGESESTPGQPELKRPASDWVPALMVGRESRPNVLKHLGKRMRVNLRGVDYARLNGTSMATPHVTAVAALVWSARPSLTAAEVRSLLERSAKDLGAPGHDSRYGHGLVQARQALDALPPLP